MVLNMTVKEVIVMSEERRRSTTHELRAWLGLSQREFAERFRIPVPTVRNWDARGTMPDYVGWLIRLYVETENNLIEYMIKAGDLPFSAD